MAEHNLQSVTKKDERLARTLLWIHLLSCGFPRDEIEGRVDEAWPGSLKQARYINRGINAVSDYELDGFTTDEEISLWSDDLMTEQDGRILKHTGCHADRDGDCDWQNCPQLRDDEPIKTGRHCPLDIEKENE